MGFTPLVRQHALTIKQWSVVIADFIVPKPAEAIIINDQEYDTESDAGWYPYERDIEHGL